MKVKFSKKGSIANAFRELKELQLYRLPTCYCFCIWLKTARMKRTIVVNPLNNVAYLWTQIDWAEEQGKGVGGEGRVEIFPPKYNTTFSLKKSDY